MAKEKQKPEVVTLKVERTNEVETTVIDAKFAAVEIRYFWDSHGTMVPWTNSKGESVSKYTNAHVVIKKKTYNAFGESFEEYTGHIDDQEIEGEIVQASGKSTDFRIKSVMGAG